MLRRNKNLLSIGLVSVLWLCPLSAKADGDSDSDSDSDSDALEQFNQSMHDFNQKYYTSPESGASQFVIDTVPEGLRRGLNNFFANLGEPVVAVSSLAQGDVGNAELAARRFFYNLVWGYGGVYDRASAAGVNPEPRDMGEVVCSYGLPDGPFLELPFYGPATVGDLIGSSLPLVAGYVILGELFFFYRASSRVASFMDDKATDGKNSDGQAAQTGEAKNGNAKTNETADVDTGKTVATTYQEDKEHYLASRITACKSPLPTAGPTIQQTADHPGRAPQPSLRGATAPTDASVPAQGAPEPP